MQTQKLNNNVVPFNQQQPVVLSHDELATIPAPFYELNEDQVFNLLMSDKITQRQFVHIHNVVKAKMLDQMKAQAAAEQPQQPLNYELVDDKDKPIKCHENLNTLLEYNNIKVKYNEMSREVDVEGTKYNSLNHSITYVYSLAHKSQFKLAKSDVVEFMDILAIDNKYNPVVEWLEQAELSWDGISRLQQLVDTLITDDEKIDPELKYELIKTWLVSTVRITSNTLYRPINVEGLLVLQGGQGVGKTTWIKELIPTELIPYFKEGVQLNVDNKDSIYEATCNWICELGELDGTLKREQAALKAFFTKSVDVQRRPYQVKEEKYPRLTSFFGTVNDNEFLQDDTGDRRYWVIPIEGIKLEKLQALDMQQVWGEVVNILRTEYNAHQLKPHIKDMLNESNSNYRVTSNVQIKVETHFNWAAPKDQWQLVESSAIADRLGLKSSKGIKAAIEKCGGEFKRTTKTRGYLVPPFKSVYSF